MNESTFKLGNTGDKATKEKKQALSELDPKTYKAVDEDTIQALLDAPLIEARSMLDGFVTNEQRYLCRFFGTAVKASRKEMSDQIY